jgi:predicted phage terminase large subunit-like protein
VIEEGLQVQRQDDRLVLVEQAELQLLEGDLYEFTKEAWPQLSPHVPFVDNWHLEAVCDHLQACTEGDIQNLIINIPPRHLKSQATQVYWPAWVWAKHPQVKFLCVAYNKNLVARDARKCRNILMSQWYQDRWGNKFQLSEDQNVKYHYENTAGGVRMIGSFEGGVTGEGGDYLVVDDPTQLEDAHNVNALKHAQEIWDGTLATRVNNPVTAVRVIIMQRLNDADLTGHIMANEHGWVHLYLPAKFEPKRRTITYKTHDLEPGTNKPKIDAEPFFVDPRKYEGELLHPQRFPENEIAKLEAKGDLYFAGQQQQRPVVAAGKVFKRVWFKHYQSLPRDIDRLNDSCISIDCAFKDTKKSSHVVGTAWARKGADVYLLYRIRKRLDFLATLDLVETMSKMFPWIGPKYVEDKANGPAVISVLRSKISGLIAVSPEGSKESRAHAITYLYQSGNVWHPEPSRHAWVKEFEDHLAAFHAGALETDDADSTSQALFHHFHVRPASDITLLDILRIGEGESMITDQLRVF